MISSNIKKTAAATLALSLSLAVPAHATGVVLQNPALLTTAQLKAVVITQPDILTNFTLQRTLARILATAKVSNAPADRQALLQTFVDSFTLTSRGNNGINVPLTPRPNEAALLVQNLLNASHPDGLRPVAVTNRLDLAPADGSNCGEQRIIYEKGTNPPPTNRMTLIFESVIPNPTPASGLAGCLPIAQLWKGLEAAGLSNDTIRTRLENYFYTGILPSGQQVQSPVHFLSYGNPLGQVRLNTFVNTLTPADWMLREYRIQKDTNSGKVFFMAATVDNSPLRAFYAPPSAGDSTTVLQRKTDCQNSLVGSDVREIFASDIAQAPSGTLTSHQLISQLGLSLLGRCKGAENDPSSPSAETSILAPRFENNPQLDSAVQNTMNTQLAAVPYRSRLNTDMAEFRFNTQSCAGCHQLSNGAPIAPQEPSGNIVWPASLGFVHIDEAGNLSPLLRTQLLPARYKSLSDFVASVAVQQSAPGSNQPFQPATVQVDLNTRALQDKILNGQITNDDQELQITTWRENDRNKQGAFVKVRPTH